MYPKDLMKNVILQLAPPLSHSASKKPFDTVPDREVFGEYMAVKALALMKIGPSPSCDGRAIKKEFPALGFLLLRERVWWLPVPGVALSVQCGFAQRKQQESE